MATAIYQSVHRDRLLAANRDAVRRIRDAVGNAAAEALMRRPPDGAWTIAEVLEHLIISADSYLDRLRPIVETGNSPTPRPDALWKPSFMGSLLVGSFRSPRKMHAPRIYRPGPTPRACVLEEFIKRQEEVERLITEGAGLDWRHIHFKSPAIGLIRMNLGDAFAVPVVHAERHAGQIERLKATMAKETQ